MSGGRYAAGSDVPIDRSRAEIEKTLVRYGATSFVYGWDGPIIMIGFKMRERLVRFQLPMPNPDSDDFWTTPTGRERTSKAARDAYEAEARRRWRALNLVIKAKLEAIDSGITSFDEEFLAHIVLPTGPTVGQWVRPQIERVYRTGEMPALLPGLGDDDVLALGEGER